VAHEEGVYPWPRVENDDSPYVRFLRSAATPAITRGTTSPTRPPRPMERPSPVGKCTTRACRPAFPKRTLKRVSHRPRNRVIAERGESRGACTFPTSSRTGRIWRRLHTTISTARRRRRSEARPARTRRRASGRSAVPQWLRSEPKLRPERRSRRRHPTYMAW